MRVLPGIIYGIVVVVLPFSTSGGQKSSAQYSSEVTALNENEVTARELIAQEQTQIGNLKRKISETVILLSKTVLDQYSILKITVQDVERASSEIFVLLDSLKSVNTSSPIVLKKHKVEILQYNAQASLLKSNSVFHLPKFSSKLIELDQLLSSINNRLLAAETATSVPEAQVAVEEISLQPKAPKNIPDRVDRNQEVFPADTYVVKQVTGGNRETLFLISGYSQIYGDPQKWYRIYLANKDEIDRNYEQAKSSGAEDKAIQPYNFIIPGQVLRIPR